MGTYSVQYTLSRRIKSQIWTFSRIFSSDTENVCECNEKWDWTPMKKEKKRRDWVIWYGKNLESNTFSSFGIGRPKSCLKPVFRFDLHRLIDRFIQSLVRVAQQENRWNLKLILLDTVIISITITSQKSFILNSTGNSICFRHKPLKIILIFARWTWTAVDDLTVERSWTAVC